MTRTASIARIAAAMLALLIAPTANPAARAGVTYKITVDTSGLTAGTQGYFDLQFNPADPGDPPSVPTPTPVATATVSGFTGYAALDTLGSPDVQGNVLGSLASGLTLTNSTAYNDYFASVTFGDSLEFLLNLDGPAFHTTGNDLGSSFLFALYQADGTSPLNGVDATVAQLDLLPYVSSPGVAVDIVTGSAYAGGPDASVTAVPEASTVMMGGLIALAGLIAARRGRRTAA